MSKLDNDITARLLESTLRFAEARPAESDLDIALHCLQDWMTVLLAGWNADIVSTLIDYADDEGGKPRATLFGDGARANCATAALINGTASHVLDFDDAHLGSRVHPSAPLWPAILSISERHRLRGRAAMRAFIAGVQMQTAVAALIGESHYRRGWHNTATLGSLGATLACAYLLGLDADRTRHAIGLAATRAGGLRAVFGSVAKPLQVGQAAATGIWAAEMARRGVSSVSDVMSGETGFLALYGDGRNQPSASMERLVCAADTITFKYHASCYGTQAPIEAALCIASKTDCNPAAIERVRIEVEDQYLTVCNIARPTTIAEAKFSIRHMVALALCGASTVDARSFSAAMRDNPMIDALRGRMKVVGADRARATARVDVVDRTGRTISAEVDASRPESDLRRQRDKIDQKTRALLGAGTHEIDADTLIAACRKFGAVADVATWAQELYGASRRNAHHQTS